MANGYGWNSVTLIGILKLSPAGLRSHRMATWGGPRGARRDQERPEGRELSRRVRSS
jgi:hypothetical protein